MSHQHVEMNMWQFSVLKVAKVSPSFKIYLKAKQRLRIIRMARKQKIDYLNLLFQNCSVERDFTFKIQLECFCSFVSFGLKHFFCCGFFEFLIVVWVIEILSFVFTINLDVIEICSTVKRIKVTILLLFFAINCFAIDLFH